MATTRSVSSTSAMRSIKQKKEMNEEIRKPISSFPFTSLPTELQTNVFRFLDPESVKCLMLSSKQLNQFAKTTMVYEKENIFHGSNYKETIHLVTPTRTVIGRVQHLLKDPAVNALFLVSLEDRLPNFTTAVVSVDGDYTVHHDAEGKKRIFFYGEVEACLQLYAFDTLVYQVDLEAFYSSGLPSGRYRLIGVDHQMMSDGTEQSSPKIILSSWYKKGELLASVSYFHHLLEVTKRDGSVLNTECYSGLSFIPAAETFFRYFKQLEGDQWNLNTLLSFRVSSHYTLWHRKMLAYGTMFTHERCYFSDPSKLTALFRVEW